MIGGMTESFPRQHARTRRFTLGVPRAFNISPNGCRVAFLRSRSGNDPVNCLWVLDTETGTERLAADPRALGSAGSADNDLPPQERARRERAREQAGGIVSYACDSELRVAVFALSGHVYVADLTGSAADGEPSVDEVPVRTPAVDPRPDPDGRRVAYVSGGALRVADLAGQAVGDRVLAEPDAYRVTYGLAEFVAAEEMKRLRGFWWAPDGTAVLAARVDERMVARWYIADPANPDRPPAEVAYPAAGTMNADVSLTLLGLNGDRTEVVWDRGRYPYLAAVCWENTPVIVVQSRDQREMLLLAVDRVTGATSLVRRDTDAAWVDVVPGVPAWTASGGVVWTGDRDGARRLFVAPPADLAGAAPVTPPDLQVRGVLDVDGDTVLFAAAREPTEIELWTYGPGGLQQIGLEPGVHSGRRSGGTTVIASRTLGSAGTRVDVFREGHAGVFATIESLAERPDLPTPGRRGVPQPEIFLAGSRQIRTAVLLPSWHRPGSGKLPVLLAPYGGPQFQEVIAASGAYLVSQWFANQGFAVVIADGRGTGGRGQAFDRAVLGDLAGPPLEDQIEALYAAAARLRDLDLDRVGIRGWSFGGYLAALAVLRRPDVFHVAVAGAPVTEWRLYDTHYTERYLGNPRDSAEAYDRCSLLADAQKLSRPLLLVHGLLDDNVVVAHTLRLSSALLAAGRPHSVLPLSGSTHMAAQEEVAENLLLLQVDFLRRALGMEPPVV
jgi:dipeptidyl-peptidase 4